MTKQDYILVIILIKNNTAVIIAIRIKILQYFSGYNCIYNVGNSEKYLNIYQIIFLIVLTITFLCVILKLTYEHISI